MSRQYNRNKIHEDCFNDVGSVQNNGKREKWYETWRAMLRRTHCKNTERYENYKDCSVCDEWKLASNFKKWFDQNYIDGYYLDKDLLYTGNKVYSPETCSFVTNHINTIFNDCKSRITKYMKGVSYNSKRNVYQVNISKYNKLYRIGRFKTELEAHMCWVYAKRSYVRSVAIESYMKNEISEKLMNAIIKKAYNEIN